MIDVQIEDERGAPIKQWESDGEIELLLGGDLDRTSCLRFIDPYGNTIFNCAQTTVLLQEMRRGLLRHKGENHQRAEALLKFLEQAEGQAHWYIRFIGD